MKKKYRKGFGMSILIWIFPFFPLNCWMDRGNDHNPIRLTDNSLQ